MYILSFVIVYLKLSGKYRPFYWEYNAGNYAPRKNVWFGNVGFHDCMTRFVVSSVCQETNVLVWKNPACIRFNQGGGGGDLMAATGLVILLKWEPNHRFVTRMTLKFDGWPRKTIGHLFHAPRSYMCHFIATCEFKLGLQSENPQFGLKLAILSPVI